MATLEKLKQRHKELGEEIERLEKQGGELHPPGVWRPLDGERGYSITSFGDVVNRPFVIGEHSTAWLFAHNQLFKTREQANTYIRVMNRAIKLRGNWVQNWATGYAGYEILWNHAHDELFLARITTLQSVGFHFPSREVGLQFIDEHTEEELKIWLGWR